MNPHNLTDKQLGAFNAKVDRTATPAGCWEWAASIYPKTQYGQYAARIDGVNYNFRAHRLALELHLGVELPRNETANHGCNNRRCCRVHPEHVRRGTQSQNMHDRNDAGNAPDNRGVNSGMAKLTEEQVREIRARYVPMSRQHGARAIARDMGVSHHAVLAAANERSYANVA